MSRSGVKELGDIACGYLQMTTLTASIGMTIPDNASSALIQCEAQPVRWRDDGTDPTSTVGMMMAVGDLLQYDGTKMSTLKFIETAVGAKLNISFYS
jgi:hypothetical protein